MDGPLFIDPNFREQFAPHVDFDDGSMKRIDRALALDDKHDFVELVNNLSSYLLDKELSYIITLMFFWDSGKCAAAVLDGEPKIPKATWLSEVYNTPLHYAARTKCCDITALLLQRGFSADVRAECACVGHTLKDALPLAVSLSMLRFHLWRDNGEVKYSAIDLVRELSEKRCRTILETLRLLAQNTRDVKREFFNYLKEGKMVEVAALLLVAKSRVLSSSTAKGEFRSVSEMHDFILSADASLAENNKLAEREEMLVLLEIFDKLGDKLATLVRLDFTQTGFYNCSTLVVESIIEDAGYEVKAKCCYYDSSEARGFTKDSGNPFIKIESSLLEKGIDECKKAFFTTDVFPRWVKESALRGLDDKSGNSFRRTYPLLSKLQPVRNRVSVPPLESSSALPMPENMPLLHHLAKKTAPALGAVKRVLRPA